MTESVIQPPAEPPGMLFDLDGTLIDSVYQHVLAGSRLSAGPESTFRYGRFIDASA